MVSSRDQGDIKIPVNPLPGKLEKRCRSLRATMANAKPGSSTHSLNAKRLRRISSQPPILGSAVYPGLPPVGLNFVFINPLQKNRPTSYYTELAFPVRQNKVKTPSPVEEG